MTFWERYEAPLMFLAVIIIGGTFILAPHREADKISANTLERVSERTQYLMLRANSKYGHPIHLSPVIIYEPLRDGGEAGYTDCMNVSIHLDSELAIVNPDTLVNEVLAHEMSHLVHCGIHGDLGNPPHNSEWQDICRFFGGTTLCEP